MKIIEALKLVKDLERKLSDIQQKIGAHSADMDYETAIYPDQKEQVRQWLQACKDIVQQIGKLKYQLTKTNVLTQVTIVIDGVEVTKSITEWIDRRRTLAQADKRVWMQLTNRNLKDMRVQQSQGQIVEAKVRYYYDPQQKDKMIEIYSMEPSLINSKLEIVNCITDLVE